MTGQYGRSGQFVSRDCHHNVLYRQIRVRDSGCIKVPEVSTRIVRTVGQSQHIFCAGDGYIKKIALVPGIAIKVCRVNVRNDDMFKLQTFSRFNTRQNYPVASKFFCVRLIVMRH